MTKANILRLATGALILGGLVLAPLAGAEPVGPRPAPPGQAAPAEAPDSRAVAVQAARIYLGQSLNALIWGLRYARQAGQLGPLEDFDLDKFVSELDLVAAGLQRYLHPSGPLPGPTAPVEITGQFLHEGLAQALPPPAVVSPPMEGR